MENHGAATPMESALQVLILIIMEDTQGEFEEKSVCAYEVLILIIMEDTHGALDGVSVSLVMTVLILIIMEDTHGASGMW